jgi:hypothetical protein
MRASETGLFNSFEDVERCELRQLDGAFVDEMIGDGNNAFFEEGPLEGLAAASWSDDSMF